MLRYFPLLIQLFNLFFIVLYLLLQLVQIFLLGFCVRNDVFVLSKFHNLLSLKIVLLFHDFYFRLKLAVFTVKIGQFIFQNCKFIKSGRGLKSVA